MKKTLRELVEEHNRLIEQDSQSAHERAKQQDIKAIEKKLGRPLTDEEKANVYGRFQGVVQTDPPRASAAHEQIRKVIDEKAKQNDPEIDALIEARDISGQFCKAVDEMHRELLIERGQSTDRQEQAADAAKEEPARNTSSPSTKTSGGLPNWPAEVLRRRLIVRDNPGLWSAQLCKVFDSESIGMPSEWEEKYAVTTWGEAYTDKKARAAIQRIISSDREALRTV